MRERQEKTAHDLDEAALRRVRWRLAGLMIALLSGLLLVLGASVYLTMQNALLQPARQEVQSRATMEMEHLVDLERSRSEINRDESLGEQEQRGVFITFADPALAALDGSATPFGKALPDPAAARQALASATPLFTTRSEAGQAYLIYSQPVRDRGHIVGVIQTGISRQQYEEGLQALLIVLVAIGGLGLAASAGVTAVVVCRALLPIRASMGRQRDFVADAAHELRTPLAIIRTAAELGLSSEDVEDLQAALEQTLVQGSHLSRLVDDLSLLARADSGAVTLDRTLLDVAGVVAETVSALEILAEDRGVHVDTALAANVVVQGDAGRLRQLVLILLDNALKYTSRGDTVTVSVRREGDRAELRVRDTGPGIAPQHLPHIFDRFYRADRSDDQGKGAGLGLAIARWIVEAHHGHIAAATEPGEGAVFTVTLPLASRSSGPKWSSRQTVSAGR